MSETLTAEEYVRKKKICKAMQSIPLSPFDVTDKPDGLGAKKFARCGCRYLEEMYDDVTNKSSNYVTCIDKPLHDEKISKDEFKGLNISTIIKGYDGSYNITSPATLNSNLTDTSCELICSRLANLFGVKTQYVAPIKGNPYCCIIVDFLKDNEEFMDFKEFTGHSASTYLNEFDIGSWIGPLSSKIFFQTPDAMFNPELARSDINRVVEDFARQYLFKKYIVHDSDLCVVNIGVIVTPDGKTSCAPAFDFSACLSPGVRTPQGQGMERDIEYLNKNYPKILKHIINDFEVTSEKESKIKDIVQKFAPDSFLAKDYINLVLNSSLSFVETAKDIIYSKENDKEM